MKKFSILTILLVIALVCNAQKPVKLRLNLPKGKTFTQNMEINVKMNMDIQGIKMDTDIPFAAKISYQVEGIKNSNFVLECTYESMKMSMNLFGQKMSYDSSDKKQNVTKSPFVKVLSAFLNKSFTMILDNQQNIVAIEGIDKIFTAIFRRSKYSDTQKEQMTNLLNGMFSEAKIKENFSTSNIIFPQAPVTEGFSWTTETLQNLQGINLKAKNVYTVEKINKKTAEISSVTDYQTNLQTEKDEQNINIELEDANATGFYVIDLKTGWTTSANINIDMTMVMTTNQSGIEISMPMQLTMEIILK